MLQEPEPVVQPIDEVGAGGARLAVAEQAVGHRLDRAHDRTQPLEP